MAYYIGKKTDLGFTEAIEKVTDGLKNEGFGILTEINVKDKLKEKLDLDFRPYIILGACIPMYAYEAIMIDDKIGAVLPCNFVIQETSDGTEVFAMNPHETLSKVLGAEIEEITKTVTGKVRNVIDSI